MVDIVFLTHFVCSILMTGIVWVIQKVQYPSFKYIPKEEFLSFHKFHSFHITWIVAPIMIVELVTAILLVYENYYSEIFIKFLIILLINLILWIATFFLSVPCHNELSKNKSDESIARLVRANWIRTFFWTIKSIFLIVLIV